MLHRLYSLHSTHNTHKHTAHIDHTTHTGIAITSNLIETAVRSEVRFNCDISCLIHRHVVHVRILTRTYLYSTFSLTALWRSTTAQQRPESVWRRVNAHSKSIIIRFRVKQVCVHALNISCRRARRVQAHVKYERANSCVRACVCTTTPFARTINR